MDKKNLPDVVLQFQDGAITYVELVRWVWSQVTEQDVLDHNGYFTPAPDGGSVKGMAEWPFQG